MNKEIIAFYNFKETAERLLKSHSITLLKQGGDTIKKSYPSLYSDLKKYYEQIMLTPCDLRGCSTVFLEKFSELRNLSYTQICNKMELKSRLKDDRLFVVNDQHYSNKSPHLTNEICAIIYKRYGASVFDYYEQVDTITNKPVELIPDKPKLEDLLKHFNDVEMLDNKAKPVIEAAPVEEKKPNFDGMKYNELRNYAKIHNIKLKATKTADIINELKSC